MRMTKFLGFTLAEGATHVTLPPTNAKGPHRTGYIATNHVEISQLTRSAGFTLAEVLITLGIIGVVAAITIPLLFNKCRISVLHNQFKMADSLISRALANVSNNLDLRNLDNIRYRDYTDEQINEMNEIFLSNFKELEFVPFNKLRNINLVGYGSWNKTDFCDLHQVQSTNGIYILKNGVAITKLRWDYYYDMSLVVDINGLYNGPNRVGYDVFIYAFGQRAPKTEYHCQTAIYARDNYSCYRFAKTDINPQDKSKKYWASLK